MIRKDPARKDPARRCRWQESWWIALVVLVPVIVLTAAAVWILLATTHPASASDQIDLVKIALSVGAGTGDVVALVMTVRRQVHTERDATERRITELYGRAVDQFGSENFAVQLAGLYSLEHLGNDALDQQQPIISLLCAYLRAPFTLARPR